MDAGLKRFGMLVAGQREKEGHREGARGRGQARREVKTDRGLWIKMDRERVRGTGSEVDAEFDRSREGNRDERS